MLVDLIRAEVDYVRNETILVVKQLCIDSEEMQKSLAYQGVFEALADILIKEEGVIISDCLSLIQALSSDFTKSYLRQVPSFLPALKSLFTRLQSSPLLLSLLHSLLKDSKGELIHNTQFAFSVLIEDIVALAFPVERAGKQSEEALGLLCDLLRGNTAQQRDLSLLLLPAGSDFLSFFDLLLSYSVNHWHFKANREVLSLLTSEPDLQTQLISKITVVLTTSNQVQYLPPFNSLLITALDTGKPLEALCSVLEVVLSGNDVAKELAASLPINSHSQTLLQRLAEVLITSLSSTTEAPIPPIRLLSIWVFRHHASAQSLYAKLLAVIPDIVEGVAEEKVVSKLFAVLLACLVDALPDSTELGKLILGKIGLPAYCTRLESFFTLAEAGKHLKQGLSPPSFPLFTPSFALIYRDIVPAAKKSLVRLMSGATSGREQELARLIQTQEQIIEDLQTQMRMKLALGLVSAGEGARAVEGQTTEALELRVRLAELETRAEREGMLARQEAQGAIDAYLHSQDRIAALEARIQRLEEENTALKLADSDSRVLRLAAAKDLAEREGAYLREEVYELRTTLRKIALGKRREGENSETGLRIGLDLPQFLENTPDSPVQSQDFPVIAEATSVQTAVMEEEKEESREIEPVTETIRQSPAVRAKLFTESPAFPDISDFMGNSQESRGNEEGEVREIEPMRASEEKQTASGPVELEPLRSDSERTKPAETVEPSPPKATVSLPAPLPQTESTAAPLQQCTPVNPSSPDLPVNSAPVSSPTLEEVAPPQHSVPKPAHIPAFSTQPSDPLLIPFPSVADAEAFFNQASSKHSRRPNPFAF